MSRLIEDSLCYKCNVRPARTVYNGKCEECAMGISSPPLQYIRKEKLVTVEAGGLGEEELLSQPISNLSFPQKIINGLDNMGIMHVGELVQKTEQEILQEAKWFGPDTLEKIKRRLHSLGLGLKESKKTEGKRGV